MTAQIIHEAEHTRQHARYQIPTLFVTGNHRLPVNEWSVSGLSLEKAPEELRQQQVLKGRLVFDFGEVDTSIEIELELMHHDQEQQLSGYRYVNLGRVQLSTLHQMVNAMLSGDVVDAGEVIEVIKRDAFTPLGVDQTAHEKKSWAARFFTRLRRLTVFLLFLVIVVALLAFIALSTYNRLFVLESIAARVDGPLVVIRAPMAGYFNPLDTAVANQKLEIGDLLATIRLIGGGSTSIVSPCHCRVVSGHILNQAFAKQGESLLTLMPLEEQLFVIAQFDFTQVSKLVIGQSAQIHLVTGEVLTGKVSAVRSGQPVELRHAAPLNNIPVRPIAFADVIIEPVQSLDINLLGSVASVTIDTFSQPQQVGR